MYNNFNYVKIAWQLFFLRRWGWNAPPRKKINELTKSRAERSGARKFIILELRNQYTTIQQPKKIYQRIFCDSFAVIIFKPLENLLRSSQHIFERSEEGSPKPWFCMSEASFV